MSGTANHERGLGSRDAELKASAEKGHNWNALFMRADWVVKSVMGILAFMSVWSWAIAIDKAEAEAKSLKREAEAMVRSRLAGGAVVRAEALLRDALDSNAQNKILSASIKEIGELNAS